MKQSKMLKVVLITWMFIFMASIQMIGVQAASLGTSIDYDERAINVTTSNNDGIVKYSFDNKVWIYAVKTASGWIIDISSISESKNSMIYIIGDKSTDVKKITMKPNAIYSGTATYYGIDVDTKKAHSINVETTKNFEYRTTVNASWKLSTALAVAKVIPVNSLEVYGGTVYIRDAGYTSGSGVNIEYVRPSKIKSVKVPKSANMPSVKLNALTGYITGINQKTMEIRVDNSTGVVDLALAFGASSYMVSHEAGWYKTTLTTLDVGKLAANSKITVSIRTFAKAPAPASRIKEFEIGQQVEKPSCTIANVTSSSTKVVLSYVDQVVMVDQINKYEYAIVPTTNTICSTTSWITLSKYVTSLETAVTALKKDSNIYFRIKGINATTITPTAILASAAESYPCKMRPALKTIAYDSSIQSIKNSNSGTAIEYTTNKSKWSSGATIKLPVDNDYGLFDVSSLLSDTKSVPLYLRIAASNTNKVFPSVAKTITLPKLTTTLKFKRAMGDMIKDGLPKAGNLILTSFPNLAKGFNKALTGNENTATGIIKVGYNVIAKSGASASISSMPNPSEKKNRLTYNVYSASWNASNIIAGNKTYGSGSVDQVIVHESMHAIMNIATSKGMLGGDRFPGWFIEGTAQMAGGITGWSGSLDTSSPTLFKNSFNKHFTKSTNEDNYCMGYFAISYLSYIAGGGSISNLDSISGSSFNSTVKTGLNNIFGYIVNGNSLSTAIANSTSDKTIKFTSLSDFINQLKVCDENFYKFCSKAKQLQNAKGGSILTTSPDISSLDILSGVTKSTRFDIDTTTTSYENLLDTFWIGGGKTESSAYQEENIKQEEIIYE